MNPSAQPIGSALPEYLGFGVLDGKSVSRKAGTITANYVLGDELVYRVVVSNSECLLTEFLDGSELTRTVGPTLRQAFFSHLAAVPPYQHRRFERLYHRMTESRNVLVRFPSQPRFVYFPAGYIYAFLQPIVPQNQVAWQALRRRLERQNDSLQLQFDGEKKGAVFRLLESGRMSAEEVVIGHCSALLLRLADAVDLMWQSGVIPREKEYRLAVMDSSESMPGNVTVYLGELTTGVVTFAVVVTEGADEDIGTIVASFRDGSKRFLEGLRQKTR